MNILDETNKIIEANGIDALGTYLLWFVQKALPKKEITIYEAFQLMEMSIRYRDYISQSVDCCPYKPRICVLWGELITTLVNFWTTDKDHFNRYVHA